MNKHTPQEWADWTGCYIAQDEDGAWFLYRDKPSRALHKQYWGSFNGFYICIPKDFIDVPADGVAYSDGCFYQAMTRGI